VLFNLLGISDQAALDRAEADIVSARLVELANRPISGNFDVPHLQAIHRHLFLDIYEWAGSLRTIGISKGNPMFCMPAHRFSRLMPSRHPLCPAEQHPDRHDI